MQFKRLTIKEIFDNPNFVRLTEAYRQDAGHSALNGFPDKASYLKIEEGGFLRASGVLDARGNLVGLVVVILTPSLHNTKTIAFVDSLFLDGSRRKGRSGIRLIKEAEKLGREAGAHGIRFSCPAGSRQEKLFDRLFVRSDVTYYKSLEE